MVREPPTCPVCGLILRASGVNPDMYYCMKRKVWEPDLGIYLDIVDSTIYVDPEGKQILRVIEIPPFSFTIVDDDQKQETVIRKVIAPERSLRDRNKARTLEIKIIFNYSCCGQNALE